MYDTLLLFRHTFGQPCHFMDRDAMEWLTDEGIYKVYHVYIHTSYIFNIVCVYSIYIYIYVLNSQNTVVQAYMYVCHHHTAWHWL
jgi:hypothetical protein